MTRIIAILTMLLIWVAIPVLTAYGWIANIFKLIATHSPYDLLFIARCVGIVFPPLGAVLGYVG